MFVCVRTGSIIACLAAKPAITEYPTERHSSVPSLGGLFSTASPRNTNVLAYLCSAPSASGLGVSLCSRSCGLDCYRLAVHIDLDYDRLVIFTEDFSHRVGDFAHRRAGFDC